MPLNELHQIRLDSIPRYSLLGLKLQTSSWPSHTLQSELTVASAFSGFPSEPLFRGLIYENTSNMIELNGVTGLHFVSSDFYWKKKKAYFRLRALKYMPMHLPKHL